MQSSVLSTSLPSMQQQYHHAQGEAEVEDQRQRHPYSDAQVAATLSQMPFSDFCKLRDVWAEKQLIRGRYEGLCGGDPTQRERREDFENISVHPESSSASSSSTNAHTRSQHSVVLPGQVEAYSRSAAGKTIDPRYQRTPLALEKGMHFLVEHYLRRPHTPLVYSDPFRIWGYLWDRFRGIRTTWGPQLPPSNVSVKGYVDSVSAKPLSVDVLHQESYRRVRWLEFTAAALAVGGAYLCLTPKGCQRFMQDKKQFIESMSQCFTDLTVFYRAEQRHRNAEFFSVLLLLYGLNQEMKVEDRATFCRFHTIQVNGESRLCPEPPAESVNLAQVNRELERQPYMMEAQPVRAALELIYCWSTRRWFDFFQVCKSSNLTPLQRAVAFQSFTYARYRAVLDLVLPNLYVYPKMRVRSAVAVADLAEQLMMDSEHCLQFLKAMGLTAQLERKTGHTDTSPDEWFLHLCNDKSVPLVSAEELEERCSNKRALFFPTHPEFFGFRVWREAYAVFPDAAGLARPQPTERNPFKEAEERAATGARSPMSNNMSPAGRGATQIYPASSSSTTTAGGNAPRSRAMGNAAQQRSEEWPEMSSYGGAEGEDDDGDYYTDEYGLGDDNENGDDGNNRSHDDEGEEDEEEGEETMMMEDGDRDSGSGGYDAHPSPAGTTPPFRPQRDTPGAAEARLLREFGCPINLMEVLEVYCPPYHAEVEDLVLVDASQTLFAALRAHRAAMLRQCKRARRQARRWQEAPAAEEEAEEIEHSESDAEWAEKMEQESVSTCSSVFNSDADEDDHHDHSDRDESIVDGAQRTHANVDGDADACLDEEQLGAGARTVIAEAQRLVRSLNTNALYAEAVADQEKQRETQRQASIAAEKAAATASAAVPAEHAAPVPVGNAPLPHIPPLALPLRGSCSVVPLPDNYGDAENTAHHDDEKNRRCNSQTSRVTVESPATLPATGTGAFTTSDVVGENEGPREDSAETVEPHPQPQPTVTTTLPSASKIFPGRPGQPAFGFSAAAKSAMPPMAFNTAMPTSATTAAPSVQATNETPPATSGAAPSSPTPKAAQQHPTRDSSEGNNSGSSSNSSAPMLEYSHLKRRTRGEQGSDEEDLADEENEDESVDEFDIESDEEAAEGVPEKQFGAGAQASKARGSTVSFAQPPSRADFEVHLPADSTQSAATDQTKVSRPESSHLDRQHAASASLASPQRPTAVMTGSFTPPQEKTATRRRRSFERDAADGASESSSSGSSDDEAKGAEGARGHVGRAGDDYSAARKRHRIDDGQDDEQSLLSLPLTPQQVNVFDGLCVPLILEYLQLWTQLTHGDEGVLRAAADCVLEACASDLTSNSVRHTVARRPQTWMRKLARRAMELLTTAVLRGSMSEYGQQMWDSALLHAASPPTRGDGDSTSVTTALLGTLWSTSRDGSATTTTATSKQGRAMGSRGVRYPEDIWAAHFSRGCSPAMIPQYEVQAMLAVEDGVVPVLSTTAARPLRAHDAHRRRAQPHSPLGEEGLNALVASFAATADGIHAGASAEALAKAVAMAANVEATATHFTPSSLPSSSPQTQVVFDPSIGHYVVWRPSPSTRPAAAAAAAPSMGVDTTVLQLTSTYILISSRWNGCGLPFSSNSNSSSSSISSSGGGLCADDVEQQYALGTLYSNEKERWLAQLLLPSPRLLDAQDATMPAGRYANLRNNRVAVLRDADGAEGKTAPVLRLFQKDALMHVPVIRTPALNNSVLGGRAGSADSQAVPLATRVGLYGCTADALSRLRVRRDGGIRLVPQSKNTSVPPTWTTTPAMAHAHYTAIVAVDLANAAAMRVAKRTLAAIVDSHVPPAGVDAGASKISANTVAGVLLCAIADADAPMEEADAEAMRAQLETLFWEQWNSKHGAHTARDNSCSAPAIVSVCLVYGNAEEAADLVAQGMQTVLATYAQQAVAVLAEA